jgi:Tripartite tricarboxylate transporter family receptor
VNWVLDADIRGFFDALRGPMPRHKASARYTSLRFRNPPNASGVCCSGEKTSSPRSMSRDRTAGSASASGVSCTNLSFGGHDPAADAVASLQKVVMWTRLARLVSAPDIPTFSEMGLPALSYSAWQGFVAPKGTPRDIIAKINAAAVENDRTVTVCREDLRRELLARAVMTLIINNDDGGTAFTGSPGDFGKLIADDTGKWGKVRRRPPRVRTAHRGEPPRPRWDRNAGKLDSGHGGAERNIVRIVVGELNFAHGTGFPFGLHQGIRIGGTGCSVLMIRNFNRSQPTFTTSGPWPMHLQAPTGW